MTMIPSRALLLAAALSAAYAPSSFGEEAAASSVVLDAKNGESSFASIDVDAGLPNLPPIDFLQNNSPQVVLSSSFPTPELHSAFEAWKGTFERTYKSLHENALRKLIWLQNHARIESHNAGTAFPDATYTLGHNDFSDLTNDEFQQRFYLGKYSPGVVMPKGREDGSSWISSSSRKLRSGDGGGGADYLDVDAGDGEDSDTSDADEATVVDVPEYKNWDEDGAVTKVKNQWFCGACWAFSAVGAIEGARYIKTGNLTDLSIQQLIDCDMTDMGCGGGLMSLAFSYDEDSVGLCSFEEYPFAYHRHWFFGCKRYMPYCTPLTDSKVLKYVNVTKTEEAMKAAIATQPVSVAVSAGATDWQFYHKGVFNKGCDDPESIDHGVLAVGYGHYDPKTDPSAASDDVAGDYWLVKNSWGEGWGSSGYIQLGRGAGNEAEGGSSCVLTLASRPIIKVED